MRAEAIDDENLAWIKSEVNRMISPHLDIAEFLNQDKASSPVSVSNSVEIVTLSKSKTINFTE